jgi:hypothetical protein
MKLTATQLRSIIAEEVSKTLNENYDPKQQIVNILGRISMDLGRVLSVSDGNKAVELEVNDLKKEIEQVQKLIQELK